MILNNLYWNLSWWIIYFNFSEEKKKKNEEEERRRLEEMDEDEYNALPEAERNAIDQKRLAVKKERLLKYFIKF